jgi:uncharacterized protein
MIFSKHNIFSKIKDSDEFFIVNLLTGHADIISPVDAEKIEFFRKNEIYPDDTFIKELIEKGYLTDEKHEANLYRSKYLDFVDSREEDEIQLFFVPNYSCNFACSYCYQSDYAPSKGLLNNEIIDSFFSYIKTEFAGRKKYITVFGGEPLINSVKQKELISYFVLKSNKAGLGVSIVTNGYTLSEYIELLKQAHIREIQITLDGTTEVHDARRVLKGGAGTFEKIVEGIDACIAAKLNVNIRMVADKENIENLPDLAAYAIRKGWTSSPYFKTQIGRNYELHHCQSAPDKLFSRISLYQKLYELIKKSPHIIEFYKPSYSISRFLFENGELPDPLFDSCPACKTEWAFDYTGHIYSCTATVGKENESLGTYYPEVSRKEEMIKQWENRDVTAIADCTTCNVQLACGGGCGSVAKNRTGNICSTDCRPVKDLLELGFASYFKN